MHKTIIALFIMTVLSNSCTSPKAPLQGCILTNNQDSRVKRIKELHKKINTKIKTFDQDIESKTLNLSKNQNYKEILLLKSKKDTITSQLAEELKGNPKCLNKIFKDNLSFPELKDEQ